MDTAGVAEFDGVTAFTILGTCIQHMHANSAIDVLCCVPCVISFLRLIVGGCRIK